MSRRFAFARTCALVGIVLLFAVVPVAAALNDEQERVFFSDDVDEDPDADDVDPDDLNDPVVFAKYADVTYHTTKPNIHIGGGTGPLDLWEDGTTPWEYRKNQGTGLSRGSDQSYTFEDSETQSVGPVVSNAHVTILGVDGGAKPRLGTGSDDEEEYPMVIDEGGHVMSLFDYRTLSPPDDYCTSPDFTEVTQFIPVLNETVEVVTGGDRTCYEYDYDLDEGDRVLEIGDQTFTGGDEIGYDDVTAEGETELEVRATLDATETTTTIDQSWTPDDGWALSVPSNPSWSTDDTHEDVDHYDATISDQRDVIVTANNDLDVHQTVIEVSDDRNHVVLSFDSGDTFEERVLWSHVQFGGDARVLSPWSTYTVRERDWARIYKNGDPTEYVSDPPHPLGQHLVFHRTEPRANPDSDDDLSMRVTNSVGSEMGVTQSVQDDVLIDPSPPRFYDEIVVTRAPENATELVTIHDNEIELDVDRHVDYVQPEVTLEPLDEDAEEVRVTVSEPDGDPIVGRQLSIAGAVRSSATTDENGQVDLERTSTSIRVTTQADDLGDPGETFYDSASKMESYDPMIDLVAHTASLIQSMVFILPAVLVYAYIRHFRILE